MHGLIDYAGLFPPASLSLSAALDEYRQYLPDADRWMLGRFIIPARDLASLPMLSPEWRFSILGRSGQNADEFILNLKADLTCLQTFRNAQAASTDVFETRLPLTIFSSPETIHELIAETNQQFSEKNNLTVFYEIPLDDEWHANMTATVAAIAKLNTQTNRRNGFKFRCGGVVASAFPTADQIAHALILCRDHQVPFKATAGLHHPIRHYNESVQTKMHGFINVFGAGILAQVHALTADQTAAILNEEEPHNFQFTETHFAWKNLSATPGQITQARNLFLAYGSCSFDEPREDLQKLGWL